MVKISIIMPLYNAAKYLKECLISIKNQTFIDFELICVNDASTDDTMEILEEFQKEGNFIEILSNSERCGAAVSRNRGMKAAKGKYLSFLDGDDIFDEKMLEEAYAAMEKHELDVVTFEYIHTDSENIYEKQSVSRSPEYRERYCKMPFCMKDYMPDEILKVATGPCNKLYRREFVESNKLEFQTLSCSNDVYFVNMAVMLANRMMFMDNGSVMIYARDHSEPNRISYNRDPMCTFLAMEKLQEELINRKQFAKLYQHFYYKAFFSIKWSLEKTKNIDDARKFYNFLKEEGIDKLRTRGAEYYEKVNIYIRLCLERFEHEDFSSMWYKEPDNFFELYLYRGIETLTELFNNWREKNISVGIWGSGFNGKTLLEFCKKNKLQIDAIVDMSEQKQGTMLSGYCIAAPEEIYDKVNVIIVSAYSICDSVRKEVGGRNIEVIDLQHLLDIIV